MNRLAGLWRKLRYVVPAVWLYAKTCWKAHESLQWLDKLKADREAERRDRLLFPDRWRGKD